jgi:hypothetical protein
MSQIHPLARTTPRVRAEIKASSASINQLAECYNISRSTARKWKQREEVQDRSHRAHHLQTTLTPTQEIVVPKRLTQWVSTRRCRVHDWGAVRRPCSSLQGKSCRVRLHCTPCRTTPQSHTRQRSTAVSSFKISHFAFVGRCRMDAPHVSLLSIDRHVAAVAKVRFLLF